MQEVAAVARCDRVEFVDVRRRCRSDLVAFGAIVWLLAVVGQQRPKRNGTGTGDGSQAVHGGLELCGWMSAMLGRFVKGLGFARRC